MGFDRVVWIVLDSVGIGAMPDWQEYLDPPGADTLGNLACRGNLDIPNLRRLGIANIRPIDHLDPVPHPQGAFGRCALASPGKDTTTGHWEMAGILLDQPFPLYPNGFPREILDPFEQTIGRRTLGNCAASGTEIIRQLGEEHMRTGSPIVYTSADSVFQIAAHEETIPIDEQYRMCRIAREILTGPHEVGRVIARPFLGAPGNFIRTANRKDFAVPPPPGMLLDRLAEARIPVASVGKIYDVFLGRGTGPSRKTKTNADGMAQTLAALATLDCGLVWTNLVDFDQQYGHRNDPAGYARALEEVDRWIPQLEAALGPRDCALFTADHGCDPTVPGTDHTREYTPLLVSGPAVRAGANLGTRGSLADIGQTVAENFGTRVGHGASFLAALS